MQLDENARAAICRGGHLRGLLVGSGGGKFASQAVRLSVAHLQDTQHCHESVVRHVNVDCEAANAQIALVQAAVSNRIAHPSSCPEVPSCASKIANIRNEFHFATCRLPRKARSVAEEQTVSSVDKQGAEACGRAAARPSAGDPLTVPGDWVV